MVSLKLQKRLAASVLKCGARKIWMDPNEVNLHAILLIYLGFNAEEKAGSTYPSVASSSPLPTFAD